MAQLKAQAKADEVGTATNVSVVPAPEAPAAAGNANADGNHTGKNVEQAVDVSVTEYEKRLSLWFHNPMELELLRRREEDFLFVFPGLNELSVDESLYEDEETSFGRLSACSLAQLAPLIAHAQSHNYWNFTVKYLNLLRCSRSRLNIITVK
mgnify:CR=1 FL=1